MPVVVVGCFGSTKGIPMLSTLTIEYCPQRSKTNGATIEVAPDRLMDFRKLDLPDESFSLVVFDPPHILKRGGKNSWMKEKYGELDRNRWRHDLRARFAELFRVVETVNDSIQKAKHIVTASTEQGGKKEEAV
jgi:hypothetical protein